MRERLALSSFSISADVEGDLEMKGGGDPFAAAGCGRSKKRSNSGMACSCWWPWCGAEWNGGAMADFVTVLEDNLGETNLDPLDFPQDNRVSEELNRLFSLSKHHTFEARRGTGFSLCSEGRLLC